MSYLLNAGFLALMIEDTFNADLSAQMHDSILCPTAALWAASFCKTWSLSHYFYLIVCCVCARACTCVCTCAYVCMLQSPEEC